MAKKYDSKEFEKPKIKSISLTPIITIIIQMFILLLVIKGIIWAGRGLLW